MDVNGELVFRRDAVEAFASGAPLPLKLSPVGGEVELSGHFGCSQKSVTARPLSGEILFSLEDGLVRSARSTWRMSQASFTEDHLLFQTKQIRDLKLETRYHAERVDQETKGQGLEKTRN